MQEKNVLQVEEQLHYAMINDDIELLEQLLDDKLLFLSHLGFTITKQDDLDFHKQGICKIEKMDTFSREIRIGVDVAVVVTEVKVQLNISGQEQIEHLRYLRMWKQAASGLKMMAGSAVQVQRV